MKYSLIPEIINVAKGRFLNEQYPIILDRLGFNAAAVKRFTEAARRDTEVYASRISRTVRFERAS